MSRLVSVTITAVVCDDTDTGVLADVIFNMAEQPAQEWAEANGWETQLLDSEVTMNVQADED